MTSQPIELETVPYEKTMYPGYMVRFGAALLDLLVIAPFFILILYLNSISKNMYYFTMIPSLAFSIWYHIYLLQRYGATPGKMLSGIRVVKTNGQDPEWKEAFLRYTLTLSILIFGTIVGLTALLEADAGYYEDLGWRQKTEYLKTLSPTLYAINLWVSTLFFWSDIIVLFSNRKKRALHDLIAGTVVVRALYLKRLRLNQSTLSETQE